MKDTKTEENIALIDIRLSDIQGIHPAVQQVLATTQNLIYASAPDDYSGLALHYLLQIHPIHVVKLDAQLYVIAGFRSYELARLKLYGETQITCILHTELAPMTPFTIASIDILGSPIMYSLGTKYIQQLQALIKPFGNWASTFFPKLQSFRRIRGQKKSSD